ncbi:hypothetical protein D3875_02310 [Deinococcus cavernae]|uniref:Uncharacterized protein n=1 Tax=Deinococcus cavernae TaxID=2320857 RepID=A0A418VGF7_9DEIO|nr:hypothetical protein [Deinococcus cavernae]RJF75200.1 hypothetical protein D3875_02310 [Deinococcus cavernae]
MKGSSEAAPAKAAYMPTLMEAAELPLSLEERVERAMKTIQFLLRERLSTREYALLRACLIVQKPAPEKAAKLVSQAKAQGQLDQVTDELLHYIASAPLN